jgi:GT2 family glycosyltransferase
VFGATGAASLFSRQALDDVALPPLDGTREGSGGEVFDPLFHSFREDAELCFRLCERGWAVVYDPEAVALHRRFNLPRRRSEMPAFVNFHSLKNRYLLRSYHQSWPNALLTLIPTLARDLGALAYALLLERSSLAAYAWLWRHRAAIRARRRAVQSRKTCGLWELERWFFRSGAPL